MVIDDNPPTLFQLLRGYRPPRLMCFVLGMWSVAMAAFVWVGAVQPMRVIHECEEYRIRFGADPVYRFGLRDFHCEFQEADIERRGFHDRQDARSGKRI